MKLSEKKLKDLESGKIQIEEVLPKYFYTKTFGVEVDNILKLLDNSICSFKRIVDKFEEIHDEHDDPCLWRLLDNKKLFGILTQNNKLTQEDLRYLLSLLDEPGKLRILCWNNPLIKHIMNEFILDKELVDNFNAIIKKEDCWQYKENNIHNVFDLLAYEEARCRAGYVFVEKDKKDIDKELLKLNELNRYLYVFDFNKNQKLEVSELIKNDETTKNRLIQIVENHLESNYDFDSLTRYLKKTEKKNILNI